MEQIPVSPVCPPSLSAASSQSYYSQGPLVPKPRNSGTPPDYIAAAGRSSSSRPRCTHLGRNAREKETPPEA